LGNVAFVDLVPVYFILVDDGVPAGSHTGVVVEPETIADEVSEPG